MQKVVSKYIMQFSACNKTVFAQRIKISFCSRISLFWNAKAFHMASLKSFLLENFMHDPPPPKKKNKIKINGWIGLICAYINIIFMCQFMILINHVLFVYIIMWIKEYINTRILIFQDLKKKLCYLLFFFFGGGGVLTCNKMSFSSSKSSIKCRLFKLNVVKKMISQLRTVHLYV